MQNETQNMIKKQLTLSVVFWDAHIGCKEVEKYEKECALYGIQHILLPRGLDCVKAYEWIAQALSEDGACAANALLVTENAQLADYVYQAGNGGEDGNSQDGVCRMNWGMPVQRDRKKTGMAVVYYEKDKGKGAQADFIVQGFWEIGIQFLDRVLKRRNYLPWNILYTKRTCVREITPQDLDELFLLYQGEGITDYMEGLYERSEEEAYTKNYIDHMYYFFGYGMWVVRDRHTGALIGRAGIEHREVRGETVIELGYVIDRRYQRQGYAYEVCCAVLEYAKEQLSMDEIHCFIHPENEPSIRLAEKLGFQAEQDFLMLEEPGYMLHYRKKTG